MLHLSSAIAFSQTSHSTMRISLFGFSSSWKRSIGHAGIKVTKLGTLLIRFPLQCYSSQRPHASRSPKSKSIPGPSMEEESKAFYVVRKGDVVGIYKTLTNCQAQVSSLVCDPSVSAYKGYSLSKDAEEYLASRGLKNAIYTISSVDVKEDLFGALVPCPFQLHIQPILSILFGTFTRFGIAMCGNCLVVELSRWRWGCFAQLQHDRDSQETHWPPQTL